MEENNLLNIKIEIWKSWENVPKNVRKCHKCHKCHKCQGMSQMSGNVRVWEKCGLSHLLFPMLLLHETIQHNFGTLIKSNQNKQEWTMSGVSVGMLTQKFSTFENFKKIKILRRGEVLNFSD